MARFFKLNLNGVNPFFVNVSNVSHVEETGENVILHLVTPIRVEGLEGPVETLLFSSKGSGGGDSLLKTLFGPDAVVAAPQQPFDYSRGPFG